MEEDFSPVLVLVLGLSLLIVRVLAFLEAHNAFVADVGGLLFQVGQADVSDLVFALGRRRVFLLFLYGSLTLLRRHFL